MKNMEENMSSPKDYNRLLDEYKMLREDKNHHDTLIWQILYFYFAIAPLFLLVGGGLEEDHPGALLLSIIFDAALGVFTVFALLNHRGFWNDDKERVEKIEKNPNFGIRHFSEYKGRHKEIGLGLNRSSRLLWAIIIILLFLAALLSIGVSSFLPEEFNISKITISIVVFIFVFLLLLFLCFSKEYRRIKLAKK